MDRKNQILVVICVLLLSANAWLFFSDSSDIQQNFDPQLFTVADTVSIREIRLESSSFTNHLSRDSDWQLNEQFDVDPVFIRILLNVLHSIEVARPLSDEVLNEIKSSSELIKVYVAGDESKLFFIAGNPSRTETYLMTEDLSEGYLAEIPGYTDYLGSIFELSTQQWRDRVIFNGNWRSIQKLELDYTSETLEDLVIRFDRDFYQVDGVARMDSNAVVSYLNLFENLQANERIELSSLPVMDSLSRTKPMAVMKIEDIYFEEPRVLKVFPVVARESFQLVLDPNNEAAIFDRNRLSRLLAVPADFEYQEQGSN
jgi:hypothetical protein